ncbi:MAG TPA: DNA polymerase ligase N-terminal domain-containing protein [Phycisphaerae bacterium]|nr:DNA polymerase ligase N-terminal domain-containing protein [Phycisphaerae bacterium]
MSQHHAKTRFVLHRHDHPEGEHWDLMIEQADGLATWRIEALPETDAAGIAAVRIFDHPRRFLSYEGPLREGLGEVRLCDQGECELVEAGPTRWVFRLAGKCLRGWFTLECQGGQTWILHRHSARP